GRGYGDVLGEGAVDGVTDGSPVRAQVAPAAAALPAMSAEQRRVDGHPVTRGDAGVDVVTDFGDGAGELVPRDQWIRAGRELTGGDVQVRATDAAGPHLDHHMSRVRTGSRHVTHGDLAGFLDDGGLHAPS